MEIEITAELIRTVFSDFAEHMTPSAQVLQGSPASQKAGSRGHSMQDTFFGTYQPKPVSYTHLTLPTKA